MLQSFRGTIDRVGILSFRPETEESTLIHSSHHLAEFWAVLDQSDVPLIRDAVRAGDRRAAFSLICERSVSIGPVVSRP